MGNADDKGSNGYNNEVVAILICDIIHAVIFWVLDSSEQICINNN